MGSSKVKKGFLHYIFWFLCLVLGIACIFVAILILNPGKDVFGINVRFVSHTNAINYYKTTDDQTSLDNYTIGSVVFNGGYTNFNISYSAEEVYPKIVFKPNIIALSQSETTKFRLSIVVENNKLKINIKEPELWIGFAKSSTITLVVPRNKNFANCDFNITTTSGGVTMGDSSSAEYNIHSLNIKTNSGAITISKNLNVGTEDINIESDNSRITINSGIEGTLSIYNKTGKIKINSLLGSLYINNTEKLRANCDNVGGSITLQSQNGYIKVKNLGMTRYYSESKIIKEFGYVMSDDIIGFSYGNFTTENNTKNTNITIENMTGNATISSESGYVDIGRMNGEALIDTTSGSITIGNAHKQLDLTSLSGDIKISQRGENVLTTVHTDSGKITANFAKMGSTELYTENSNIVINVATGEGFKFIYQTKNGVNISWYTETLDNSGTEYISGATQYSEYTITATAENGRITLNDGYEAN